MNLERLKEIEEKFELVSESSDKVSGLYLCGKIEIQELLTFARATLEKEAQTKPSKHTLTYSIHHVPWQRVEQCQACKQVVSLSELKNGAWVDVWRRMP